MQDRKFEELIEELQLLRIRKTVVIAEIREAIAARGGIEQETACELTTSTKQRLCAG